jgi:hypothetical protein
MPTTPEAAAAIAEYRRDRAPVEHDLAAALGITLEEATRICNPPTEEP